MINQFRIALDSLLYEDNGNPYFEFFRVTGFNDRKWLNREETIADFSKVIRLRGNDSYYFWLTFSYNDPQREEGLRFTINIFCPDKEQAIEICNVLRENNTNCTDPWSPNGVSISRSIEVKELNNWNDLRASLRQFIGETFVVIRNHIINR